MTAPETEMLLVKEVANRLRVSKATVYRLIRAGELPALLIGKDTYRVSEDAFIEYRERCQQAAVQPA